MAEFFAILILIPLLAFVLAAVVVGAGIMLAFVYGAVMVFIAWLRH